MTCRLFDDIERTDTGPMQHSETHYEYLNRSARPEAKRIRSLLEDWFSRYPEDEQVDFLQRFEGEECDSAFFELYLHEILFRQDFKCEIHPNVPAGEKRPEFLVYHEQQQQCFYLEAKVAYLEYSRVYARFLSELEVIQSDFNFEVSCEDNLKTQPQLQDFRKWLKQKREEGQEYVVEHGGVKITITLVAKHEENGIRWGWGGLDETANAIRKAIHKKATAYGRVELPFLLAINIVDKILQKPVSPGQVVDAMFGQRVVFFPRGTQEISHARDNKSAKLLNPWGSPQNTRVSGIVVAGSLSPWTITIQNITPVLWHNPWARHPFPPELWQLPQQMPNKSEGVYEKKDGKTISGLLSLPSNWPED